MSIGKSIYKSSRKSEMVKLLWRLLEGNINIVFGEDYTVIFELPI